MAEGSFHEAPEGWVPCPQGESWVELRAACHCLTLSPGCPSGDSSCGIAVGLVPWETQVTAVVEGRCHWLCHPLLHHGFPRTHLAPLLV